MIRSPSVPFIAACLSLLISCSPAFDTTSVTFPFRTASGTSQTARTLVVLIPGALTSTENFGEALAWGTSTTLVIEYRFPGLDGRPLDSAVVIDDAAKEIASVAAVQGAVTVVLIGFSTGAAIAIEAAGRIDAGHVTVVGISSAVPFPGMIVAATRSGFDILAAAARAHSLNSLRVWKEYYKALLFGRLWHRTKETRDRAEAMLAENLHKLVTPEGGLGRAHSADLATWTLSPAAKASRAKYIFYHGQNDPVIAVAQVQKLARVLNADLRVVPNAGHLLLTVRPDILPSIRDELIIR